MQKTCILFYIISLAFGCTAQITPSYKEVVPMEIGDFPMVKVLINGKGPFNFIFDTGASGEELRLDSIFATQFQLELIDSIKGGDPSGKNSRIMPIVNIATAQIGSLKLKNIKSIISKYPYKDVAGVIGLGIFIKFLITLDFPNKQLIIEKGELGKNDSSIINYESKMGVPVCTIIVGNQKLKADIDCGNSRASIQLPEEVTSRLSFVSKPVVIGKGGTNFNKIEFKAGQIKENFFIGNIKISKPHIIFPTIGSTANLGFQFLKDYTLTFDQKNFRLKIIQGQKKELNSSGENNNKTATLADYIGLYTKEKQIKTIDNRLYYEKIGGRGATLLATGIDVFKFDNGDATITFQRNDKNIIIGFEILWYDGVKDVSEKIK